MRQMSDKENSRRYTVRISYKDPYQLETMQMLDKLMEEGKYPSEANLFREGVRALFQKEHSSGKRASDRRLLEKYAGKAVETAVPAFADVVRETVSELLADVRIPVGAVSQDAEGWLGKEPNDDVPKATGVISDSVDELLGML